MASAAASWFASVRKQEKQGFYQKSDSKFQTPRHTRAVLINESNHIDDFPTLQCF